MSAYELTILGLAFGLGIPLVVALAMIAGLDWLERRESEEGDE